MDYEKAYKEALERAKSFRTPDNKDVAAYIFPVLKESGDEKIRKALIKLVKKAGEGYENVIDGVSIENAISWIEKQGEQKSANTVKDVWKNMRLEVWAQASGNREANVSCDNTKIFSLCDIDEIIEKINDCQIKQKSAEWSKEELDSITAAINNLEYLKNNYVYHQMGLEPAITFLKSLKGRVLPQPKQEWSEEDEEIISVLNAYAEVAENDDCPLNAERIRKAVGKLEFLRHQSQWRPSEEHLDALNNMRFAVQHFGPSASLAALDDLYKQLEKLTE